MTYNPKILLLQIREEKEVLESELEGFSKHSGVSRENFEVLDVFNDRHFDIERLDSFDALFVGGSSSASVLEIEKYPFVPRCIELLKYASKTKTPVFASCFGFQLAVLAFGGEIIQSPENQFEMGIVDIALTLEAKTDQIFRNCPNPFRAVSVHREKAINCPPDCILLAHTQECVHSFKHRHSPFWAFQFHPEVDEKELCYRLALYIEKYGSQDQLEEVIRKKAETPDSNNLLKNFEILSKNKRK